MKFIKNKHNLLFLFSTLTLQLGCIKPSGNISVYYFDTFTKQPIQGLSLNLIENPKNLNHDLKQLAYGYTDQKGVFSFPADYMPNPKNEVWIIPNLESLDTNSISYKYLNTGVQLSGVTKRIYIAYIDPSGLLNMTATNNFWKNKSYDTLIIKYTNGTDTLIKNLKSSVYIKGKPNTFYLLNFYSILNNNEQQVYSKDIFLHNFETHGLFSDTLGF